MYSTLKGMSYEDYKKQAKELLRQSLSSISEEEFNQYFKECEDWIKSSYSSKEEGDASMLSYALFLNY